MADQEAHTGRVAVSLAGIPSTLRTLLPFWWSRVLFPGGVQSSPAATVGLRTQLSHLLLLVLVAALLFFSRLGTPLQEPDEARYAEVPRQMLAQGHWVVPVLHGEPYLDKPPLLYWLVMACYRAFGVEDWAARLVPGAAAFLAVLLTYLWGARTVGPRAAFAGAAVLCLSARFVYLGRLLTPDSLLCLCVTAALAAAHLAVSRPRLRWGWWAASGLACGLGLLTKGPVALALAAAPLPLLTALDPRTVRPGWRGWLLYLTLAAGVAGPWYAAMAAWDPDFAGTFFWRHNVVRYVAPFDHAKPVWFHLPGLLLGMLPWTLLLPGLVRWLGRHSARTAARRPAALGFFLLASVWAVLFYSLAGCKRAVYILPALPPLALALGCYLDAVLPWEKARGLLTGPRRHRLPTGRLALAAIALVVAAGGAGCLIATRAGLLRPAIALALAAAVAAAGGVLLRFGSRQGAPGRWALCGGATFVVLFAAIHLILPGYARRFSLRGHLRPQAELCADPAVPVVCYPRGWDSVGFYLRRSDVLVFRPGQSDELATLLRDRPTTVLVVKSDGSLEDVLRALPPSVEFVAHGRRGPVTVGQVRQRLVAPDATLARRRAGASAP